MALNHTVCNGCRHQDAMSPRGCEKRRPPPIFDYCSDRLSTRKAELSMQDVLDTMARDLSSP